MTVNRAANLVGLNARQNLLLNEQRAQKELHRNWKNHKPSFIETDDGRTLAGADASHTLIFVFIFFETAVRRPAVCRSLRRIGRQRAVRESALNAWRKRKA
jgi:hypothetical protein